MDKDYHLVVSISKALSSAETPLKMKHARSVIIATHRTKSVKPFWAIITRQPLMEHRFTAWKFCHILHKVLREGHANAIKQSQTHKTLILEVGKLWGHLQDGVGKCIELYTQLLVNKLEFHQKNDCFPGSLGLDFNEVIKMAGDDFNIYFQLCVEVFDYLDHIIQVQSQIFLTINTYRMSSMTPQGQCRLAPLITLIQDSNPLYDICVRIMFRLHDGLPHDVLLGHRNRFVDIFSKLKLFYENVRPLQYFSDVIQLPHLPENAPNFSSEVDLGNYTAPVMVLQQEPEPEPEPEPTLESLVDLSNTENYAGENNVDEKDIIIRQLQDEIRYKEMELERYSDLSNKITSFQIRNESIEREMAMTKEILKNTTLMKDNLELKLSEMSVLEGEVKEGDEKVKHMEEKFEKIKTMYTKLRDEHISLLRMRNEDSKLLAGEKNETQHLKTEIDNLKVKLEQFMETDELNTQLKSKTAEYEDIIAKKEMCIEKINSDLNQTKMLVEKNAEEHISAINQQDNQLREHILERDQIKERMETELKTKVLEFEDTISKKDTLIDKLSLDLEELKTMTQKQFMETDELNTQLKSKTIEFEDVIAKKEMSIEQLSSDLNQMKMLVEKNSEEHISLINQRDNQLKQQLLEHDQIKQSMETELKTKEMQFEDRISKKDTLIDKLNSDIQELETTMQKNNEQQISVKNELSNQLKQHLLESEDFKKSTNNDLQTKQHQIDEFLRSKLENESTIASLELEVKKSHDEKNRIVHELKEINDKFDNLQNKNIESNIAYDTTLTSVMASIVKSLKEDFSCKNFEPNFVLDCAVNNVEALTTQIEQIKVEYTKLIANDRRKDAFLSTCIQAIFILRNLHEHITSIFNNTTDMEKAHELRKIWNEFQEYIVKLYEILFNNQSAHDVAKLCDHEIAWKLNEFKTLLSLLRNSFTENINIGDMLQQELKDMDNIIEEAAKRILEIQANSKSNNDGIKLEVNEKILETCTNLMQSIIILIRKSRDLQSEIVIHGKGKFTEKEFYKRNSQWTEGLISASKNVAKGANFLVDAANKAIVLESNECFEIIVAAQEIAASTAQLVIASRVKAAQNSQKLMDLTKASRDVSLATGLVVATVKDGSNKLEYKNEIDTTNLTTSQKKAMEMEMHIKVLQLEQALDNERKNLMSFRKKFYQSSDDD